MMVIDCSDLAAAVNGLSATEYLDRIGTKRRLQILEGFVTLATSSDLGIDGRDELLEITRCCEPDPLQNRSWTCSP
ncbi:hypothetical protein DVH24_034571 [Malus domestica]|uniref:Uncharacterized protein n=1 Tax=Malus domestica TaxID=3750 RepID=A0A498J2L1_MALDO|nr:hypothetical protein DVH24_034571 [Malus domestica]